MSSPTRSRVTPTPEKGVPQSGQVSPALIDLDVVNVGGTRAATAGMTNRSTAPARGNGARWSSSEGLTLQFNQRTAGLVALGLDSRKLNLGVGQACAPLSQFGP